MADVTVDSNAVGNDNRDHCHGPFWTSPSVGYLVLQESTGGNTNITVYKTTDSGANWTQQDTANNPDSITVRSMGAYWNQQTKDNTGTIIHIVWADSGGTVDYVAFDTSDDTFGTKRTVDSLTISATSSQSDVSVVVAKNDQVYVCTRGAIGTITENTHHSMRSSTDLFASNNVSEASPYATGNLYVIKLMAGADADTSDICAVGMDSVNFDLDFLKFDNTANSWGVTSIDDAISLTAAEIQQYKDIFDCTQRLSDEHIIVAYWNDLDVSTADFKCADITQTTPTITGKTNLDSNTDDSAQAALLVNQQNDDIYCAYLGSDDGSETWTSTLRCYFKKSTDGMTSWGTEQTYGVQNDDQRNLTLGKTIGDGGGRIMPVWYNDDTTEYLLNDGNDVEVAAAAGGASVVVLRRRMEGA